MSTNYKRKFFSRQLLFLLAAVCGLFTLSGNVVASSDMRGSIREISFVGTKNQLISFSIYLPPTYFTSDKAYPVVYHLHGLGDNYRSDARQPVAVSFEKSANLGFIEEMIIVFPDGYNNSMWADSYDNHKTAESDIINEIIPLVDVRYRTNPIRENRFVQGFSMGGFGAAKFIAKYPELFCKCVIYDGGMRTWATLNRGRPQIAQEIFNGAENYFLQYAPWMYLNENKFFLALDTSIYITIGYFVTFNKQFLDSLDYYNIPYISTYTYCEHDFFCMLEREWLDVALFYRNCTSLYTDLNINIGNRFAVSNSNMNERHNNMSVNYSTDKIEKITIIVLNIAGIHLHTISETYKIPGKYRIDLDLQSVKLTPGIYFVEMNCSESGNIRKRIVIK